MLSSECKFQPHDFSPAAQVQADETTVELLKDYFYSPSLPAICEERLKKAGELVHLENAGIVPLVENLNTAHQSREELDKWNEQLSRRNEVLRYIAIGMLEGPILFSGR